MDDERLGRLAESVDGHPARFVPEMMAGEQIDAEHRGRYWWAAALARGKRVLDAGCGTGYGSNILADAGAATVAAVDIAQHVIVEARKTARPGVVFECADLARLPYDADAFDLAVCFEAIEHVESPDTVLDELARVLAADGVLAISSPNRGEYVGGNPHHRHEYVPDELETALRARWRHVRLLRQHGWLASAVLPDELFGDEGGTRVDDAFVGNVAPREVGRELYTIAVASNGPLPRTSPAIVLSELFEVRRWIDGVTTLEQRIATLDARILGLEAETSRLQDERDELRYERDELRYERNDAAARKSLAENELAAIRQTKTFRYTARARALYGLARRRLRPPGRSR